MDVITVTKVVNEQLDLLSLEQKIVLFRDIIQLPIDFKNGKYFHKETEWDSGRMSDFIQIHKHWLKISEFDRLYDYFSKLSAK